MVFVEAKSYSYCILLYQKNCVAFFRCGVFFLFKICSRNTSVWEVFLWKLLFSLVCKGERQLCFYFLLNLHYSPVAGASESVDKL